MIKRLNKIWRINFLIIFFLIFPAISSSAPIGEDTLDGVIEKIEKAITNASDLFEQGQLEKGRPFVVSVSQEIELSFSKTSFEADIEKAFKILGQLMEKKNTAETHQERQHSPQARAISPQGQPQDRLDALMQSEKETSKGAPPSNDKLNLGYSVYDDYQQAREAKMQDEDNDAEADRQIIIAERQAAEENQQRKRKREQLFQAQATKWQEQLDKQAAASVRAASAWEKEHSFGAYAKRFLGMVVQTSVGAFTGGLLGTVSTNLANKAVEQLFPDATVKDQKHHY